LPIKGKLEFHVTGKGHKVAQVGKKAFKVNEGAPLLEKEAGPPKKSLNAGN